MRAESTLSLAESLAATRRRLVEAHEATGSSSPRVTTGFLDLDHALGGGFRSGETVVVGARAGVGASTLAQTFAINASRAGNETLLVSARDGHQINCELLSAVGAVPFRNVDGFGLAHGYWARVDRAVTELSAWPLRVLAGAEPTVARLADALARHEGAPTRLLVVDGAAPTDLMDTHELARSRDLAVIFVDRVDSPTERADRPPLLEDLRCAPVVADVADRVILVHRDDVVDVESARPGEADLNLCLNRGGVTRDIVVAFQGHYRRFVDLAR